MRPVKVIAIAAVAVAVVGMLAFLVTYAATGQGGGLARVVYVTRTAPPKTIVRWHTRTVTRTVVQAVPDTGALACIDALYEDLSSDASSPQPHTLPNGWWDSRCMAYTP